MQSLPVELLDLVAAHCEHADLKNMRCSCKAFRSVTTPLVFEHHYMAMTAKHFAAFVALASSPLAKHVKKLTLFSDVLPAWSRDDWEDSIDYRKGLEAEPADSVASDDEIHEGVSAHLTALSLLPDDARNLAAAELDRTRAWNRFKKIRSQQWAWQTWEHQYNLVGQFVNLVNLTEASVTSAEWHKSQYRSDRLPVWRRLETQMLVSPDHWQAWDNKNLVQSTWLGSRRLLCPIGSCLLLIGVLLRAMSCEMRHGMTLKLGNDCPVPYKILIGDDGGQNAIIDTRYNSMVQCFTYLTDLQLHRTVSSRLSNDHALGMSHEVAQCIRAAHKLRKLDLKFQECHRVHRQQRPNGEFATPVGNIFDGSAGVLWPHLEHLALSLNLGQHVDFSGFLRHHSNRLRSLELRKLYIIPGGRSFLQEIPKILTLKHVYVVRLRDRPSSSMSVLARGTDYDDPYEKSVKAYLLGESDELPELRDGRDERKQARMERRRR